MQEETCKKCGNPKSSGSGSLTDFIRLCSCDQLIDESHETIRFCSTCGKRVESGRVGSITQFVFRSDSCSCEFPNVQLETSGDDFESKPFTGFEDTDDEAELDLDRESFPVVRYKPIVLLGSGSNGSVYLSRDRLLGKKVAVKTLHVLDSEQLIKFQNEARATSKMVHPNIIEILDFGATEAGTPYMVLEYFEGIPLTEWENEKGVISVEAALSIIKLTAKALSHSHGQGIFHRDLKPSNILVKDLEEEELKLIDFGVAQVSELTGNLTEYQGKTIAGTPNYMSPDVASGLKYTEASEVYSLGCVLFELLTGRPPFTGESSLEVLAKHSREMAPDVTSISTLKISPGIERLISRCLEKEPKKRFEDMDQLLKAIDLLRNEALPGSESSLESNREDKPKSRSPLIIFSALFLAILLGSGFYFVVPEQKDDKKRSKKSIISVVDNKGDSKPAKAEEEENLPFMDDFASVVRDTKKDKFIIASFDQKGVFQNWTASTAEKVDNEDLKILKAHALKIRGLSIRETKVTDEGLEHIVGLPLIFLSLRNSEITDGAARYVKQIKSLEQLDVYETGISDQFFKQLKNPKLRFIMYGGCENTSDKSLKIIASKWSDLIRLDIPESKYTDKGLLHLKKLKKLKMLVLNDLPVSTKLANAIIDFKRLEELHISNCKISNKDLNRIAMMPGLKRLDAHDTTPNYQQWMEITKRMRPDLEFVNPGYLIDTDDKSSVYKKYMSEFLNPAGLEDKKK